MSTPDDQQTYTLARGASTVSALTQVSSHPAAVRIADCVGLPLGCVRAIGRAMARLTLVLLGFWPCYGIRRSGLHGQSPAQWASGAVLVVSNHVSWLDILVSASPLCLGSLFPSLNLSAAGGY